MQDQRHTPSGDDVESVVQAYAPQLERLMRKFEEESRDTQVVRARPLPPLPPPQDPPSSA